MPMNQLAVNYPEEEKIIKVPSELVVDMALCEMSLRYYIEQAWPIVQPMTNFVGGYHIDAISEHLEAVTEGHITDLLINIPPRHMKLIADSEDVLTTEGWKKHGELEIGDYVFSPSGKPIKIINKTSKAIADMEVVLGNGVIIKCNKDHLWTIYDRTDRKWKTKTTRYLLNRKILSGKEKRCLFQLPRIKPLKFRKKQLPLDPYFLGVWLGDGSSTKPCITHNKNDFEHIKYLKSIDYEVTNVCIHKDTGVYTSYFTKQNIIELIRELNLYDNKHIPDIYKYSSIEQRLDLLAGFIDTDGNVSKDGRVRLCNSNKKLIDDLFELVSSLGFYPYLTESIAVGFNDKYFKNKPHYQIGFNPLMKISTKIKRKKIKRIDFVERKIGIIDIKKSKKPEQGNCITVDSKNGLYLINKKLIPTHNSFQVCVFWPTWEWGAKNQPHHQYIFASYAQVLSTRDSLRCRRLIKSPWYQERWGSNFSLSYDQDAKTKFENDKGGHRIATSVGGSNTGEGGDRIVVDDPHKINEAESDIVREQVLTWWDEEMSTRANDEVKSARVIIMQRVHEGDLAGHVLEEDHGYVHLCLPARYEPKRLRTLIPMGKPFKNPKTGKKFKDWRKREGDILWPEKFNRNDLDKREKRMTVYAVAGQHQQRPSPRGGGMFEVDRFEVVPNRPDQNLIVRSVRYWDKAGTEGGGCNTAGVKMHLLKDGFTVVIEDVLFGQWGVDKRNRIMKQTTAIDGITVKVWHEQEGGSSGKESAQITNKELAGYIVEPDRVTGSKEVRAEAYSIAVKNGYVKIVKASWNKDFIDEHEKFPNGKFKDIVDSSAGAYNKLVLGIARAGAL